MAVPDAAGNPLVPDIAALSTIVSANLAKAGRDKDFLAILANLKADGIGEPNLEQILTHIRALREVAGTGEARGLKKAQLEALDMEVCEEIVAAVSKDLPGTQTPFHRLAAWINGTARDSAVEIFTTNYDLLIEQALEVHRVPYFDGFVGGCRPFFDAYAMEEDTLPSRWARLWKLHGSINWRQTDDGIVYRAWSDGKGERYMIHPSHLKYEESRRMPYLAMLDRLRQFLRMPSAVLITCGYSFKDDDLNASLIDGLQGNPKAMMFGLGFDPFANYAAATRLAETCVNFSFLSPDKAIIGTRIAPWIGSDDSGELQDSNAIEWTKAPTGERRMASFRLGDFAKLGDFLAELVGADRIIADEKDAK